MRLWSRLFRHSHATLTFKHHNNGYGMFIFTDCLVRLPLSRIFFCMLYRALLLLLPLLSLSEPSSTALSQAHKTFCKESEYQTFCNIIWLCAVHLGIIIRRFSRQSFFLSFYRKWGDLWCGGSSCMLCRGCGYRHQHVHTKLCSKSKSCWFVV